MSFDLTGRMAIITGANQGLGREIAAHYVAAGASVLLMARGERKLAQVTAELAKKTVAPGQKVVSFVGDVSSRAACDAAAAGAIELLGGITILVNNAGVYGPMGDIQNVDWDAWVEAIEVNLFGTVLMTRAVIPAMKRAKYGKIVNLSGGGATAPLPGISAYAASKAAVVRLTETFAHELKNDHIDVNALAPGALNTRLLDEVIDAGPAKVGQGFYERALKQRDEGGVPLEKGAATTVYFGSAASDGITGRLISAVWDKWETLGEHREALAKSDIYTLRRIVPEDRKQAW